MRALDLFCGAGGAARGLVDAGYEVVGIDLAPRPKTREPGYLPKVKRLTQAYPGTFICGDALRPPVALESFDLIWARPPCQRYTRVWNGRPERRGNYPDLLGATRSMLQTAGVPWIIENVPGTPMRPDVVLTGAMFGLDIIRERWFEVEGFTPPFALQQQHFRKTVSNGDLATVAGQGANTAWNFRRKSEARTGLAFKWRDLPEDLKERLRNRNNAAGWRAAMGIDWMTRDELREAVPPAYSHHIAVEAIRQAGARAGAP